MKINIAKHALETEATPAQAWAVWEAVNDWITWDPDLAWFYAWMIGPSIKKKIPLEMERMLKKAH